MCSLLGSIFPVAWNECRAGDVLEEEEGIFFFLTVTVRYCPEGE